MLAISRIAALLLFAQAGVRDEGIAAFNEGRYSVALTKLTEAAKDQSDATAQVFLALSEAALGDCATSFARTDKRYR